MARRLFQVCIAIFPASIRFFPLRFDPVDLFNSRFDFDSITCPTAQFDSIFSFDVNSIQCHYRLLGYNCALLANAHAHCRSFSCVIMAEGSSSLRRGRATSSPIPIEGDQEEVYLITVSSRVMMCIDAEYFTEVGAAQRGRR